MEPKKGDGQAERGNERSEEDHRSLLCPRLRLENNVYLSFREVEAV